MTDSSPTAVIHGDFTSRNLLFVGDQLSGVLDFKGTHRDLRVAEFALSWRARRDDVVLGYDEISSLSETDWHLLTPCLWAWAFYGVAREAERMKRDDGAPRRFDWQVEMLLRRSPLMGRKRLHTGIGNPERSFRRVGKTSCCARLEVERPVELTLAEKRNIVCEIHHSFSVEVGVVHLHPGKGKRSPRCVHVDPSLDHR